MIIKDFINSPRLNTNYQLPLFDYKISLDPVLKSLELLCEVEFNTLPSPSLTYFKPKSKVFCTYNLNSNSLSKSELHMPEAFRVGAVWCQIADRKYFYCGGENRGFSNLSALIYPNDGKILTMPSMNATRSFHGIIYFDKTVYVFGGNSASGRLKSCEKFDFERSQWIYLPNMTQARSNFTVCANKFKIFLVGGCGANTIESFDPVEQLFSKINLSLPYPSYWTMGGCINENLIIFQGNIILNANVVNCTSSRFVVENSGGWWSEMPIYHFRENFYFFKKNTLVAYDTKLQIVKEIANIG